MKDIQLSLGGSSGVLALAEQHDNPACKDLEPKGCQSLKLARAAENECCKTVMSELITQNRHNIGTILDDPDQLLKSIMTDQIVEYKAMSGYITMGMLTAANTGAKPEELVVLKVKVDSHLLQVAKLNKQLSSPDGQIKIIANGGQVNVGLAQQIAGKVSNCTETAGDTHVDVDQSKADPLIAMRQEATVPIEVEHFADDAVDKAVRFAPDLF